MLRRNILIFHSGALGDFILTWPLAIALARVYAQSRIFYVTAAEKGQLAQRILGVESKDVESGWTHLFGDPARLPDPARRTLESTRLIINFVTSDIDPWITHARDASRGAQILTLKPRPTAGDPADLHVSRFIQSQLASNRILHEAVGQMIASVNQKGAGTIWKPAAAPLLLLHPGSGSREKCWPVLRWADLAHGLTSAGHAPRFLLGEVERERFSSADVAALQRVAQVQWLDRYSQLLDQLGTARAFVGNDSGPGHLAAVIGTPTVSLFGPTDPAVWRPLGPRVQVLAAPDINAIPVTDVLRALTHATSTPPDRPARTADDSD